MSSRKNRRSHLRAGSQFVSQSIGKLCEKVAERGERTAVTEQNVHVGDIHLTTKNCERIQCCNNTSPIEYLERKLERSSGERRLPEIICAIHASNNHCWCVRHTPDILASAQYLQNLHLVLPTYSSARLPWVPALLLCAMHALPIHTLFSPLNLIFRSIPQVRLYLPVTGRRAPSLSVGVKHPGIVYPHLRI